MFLQKYKSQAISDFQENQESLMKVFGPFGRYGPLKVRTKFCFEFSRYNEALSFLPACNWILLDISKEIKDKSEIKGKAVSLS